MSKAKVDIHVAKGEVKLCWGGCGKSGHGTCMLEPDETGLL